MEVSQMKKIHLPIIIEMDEDGYYIVSCPLFKFRPRKEKTKQMFVHSLSTAVWTHFVNAVVSRQPSSLECRPHIP